MAVLSTESKTVEEPLIKYAKKAGWQYVSPDSALNLRRGESGKFFYSVLRESLIRLNQGFLNIDNVEELIQKIDTIPDTLEGNRENLDWARGHKMFFDKQENRNRNVSLMDFQSPDNNIFQITQQWTHSNSDKTNRSDVMFLINGIPFAIVENKGPKIKNSMEKGIIQLKRYERETPEMLSCPQIFNITDALQYFYGATWNYSRKGIFNWKKEVQGKSAGKNITLEEAVLSFFEKKHFLKMIKDWVLFYIRENELNKTILKQHQTRAVEKIIKRCNEQSKKRALVWHTQGSGKTFTMITSARLILESNKKATVMMIVDRNELEGQLEGWINRIVGEMQTNGIPIEKAHSKKDLRKLLKRGFRGLIISMIHKFNNIQANSCVRDDFYIFIDEAHRSVEGDLGNYLTGALPNATLIGFTGTPVDKTSKGKGTFKVFGKDDKQGYLDKYSIAESIEDRTTVPLKHSLAPNRMTVSSDLLEKEFFQLTDTEGISDIETLNKILERSVKLKTFLKSSDRISSISRFIVDHFENRVQPLGYKAFLVAVDREACALYKKALDKHLPKEMSAVVYTKGPDDSELLRKYQLNSDKETTIRKKFIKAGQNPQILIVTDKLLTGYDAPILYCMYLDKPMRDHTLLQAIARINRPYEDEKGIEKPCGLIVDFVGVFRSVKKALSFDSDEIDSAIEDLNCLMEQFKSMITNDFQPYLSDTAPGADKLLEKLIYETLLDIEERKKFISLFENMQNLYEILSPDSELRPYVEDYRKMAELYQIIKNLYKDKTFFISEICKKTEKLIQEKTALQSFSGITKVYEINEETLRKLKQGNDEISDSNKVINLIKSIQKEALEKSREEPYLVSISEKAQKIMDEFSEKQKNSKQALEEALKLIEEKISIQKKREQSPLSPQEFIIHWMLEKQNIDKDQALSFQISEVFNRFSSFHNNLEERRLLKMDIYQILSDCVSTDEIVKLSGEIIQLIEEMRK